MKNAYESDNTYTILDGKPERKIQIRGEILEVGWLVYSSCSHLEHRASVKRFISLQFLNLRHPVGLLGE
jgi:hypothetical protein